MEQNTWQFPMPIGEREELEVLASIIEDTYNGNEINWKYWVHQMPMLTAAQASRLMSGLDPDLFENLDSRPNKNDPSKACNKAKKMQRLAETQGKITATPVEWSEWAKSLGVHVHSGYALALQELYEVTAKTVEAVPVTSPGGDDWEVRAREIADKIALERWGNGIREITARNICDAVASELAKDVKNHGNRGPRVSGSVRSVALKGWNFIPPAGTNGTSGTNE